ncbi:hypothetical protein SUGI_0431020 [Cryptomeria japonica]|nr:hypothetical protein SUGI_0431020 [Cryptomeria japonica]
MANMWNALDETEMNRVPSEQRMTEARTIVSSKCTRKNENFERGSKAKDCCSMCLMEHVDEDVVRIMPDCAHIFPDWKIRNWCDGITIEHNARKKYNISHGREAIDVRRKRYIRQEN